MSGTELKELARTGKITPGTLVESPEGKAAPAKRVKGLKFAEPPILSVEEDEIEPLPFDNEVNEVAEKTSESSPMEQVRPKLFVDAEMNFGGAVNNNPPNIAPPSDSKTNEIEEKKTATPPVENVRPKLNVDVEVNFGGAVDANVNMESPVETAKEDDLSLATLHATAKTNKAGAEESEDEKRATINSEFDNAEKIAWLQGMIRTTDKKSINDPVHEGFTLLHLAVAINNPEIIAELVTMGANVDVKNSDGRTPLHAAAAMGSVDTIKALLKAGANIKVQANDGETPLRYAMLAKHTEVAELLRKVSTKEDVVKTHAAEDNNWLQKAISTIGENDINNPVQDGLTLLHLAVVTDAPTAIAPLVKMGADVDVKAQGQTALHFAIASGNAPMVTELLKAGAGIDVKNDGGFTPLGIAVKLNKPHIADLLRKVGAKENKDEKRTTTASEPDDAGQNNWVHELIRIMGKNNINHPVQDGCTLLHLAVVKDDQQAITQLAKMGADVDVKGSGKVSGQTALHLAIALDKLEAISTLIEHGANVDAINDQGHTPLHICITNDKSQIVPILIKAGADVEAKSDNGATLLHLAAVKGNLKTITELLKAGANIHAVAQNGHTPLSIAKAHNHSESVELLHKAEQSHKQEQLQREFTCPQCGKEMALSTSLETVNTHSEFRTEIKEEWVQTGYGLTNGFYNKIPIQVQTLIKKEMHVTKCKYCNYRKEGRTYETRDEIR